MAPPQDLGRYPLNPDESFFNLLAETLESMDRVARGQFLQKFFHTIAHLDISETTALDLWDQTLVRRQELGESVGRSVSMKTAMVDVLSSSQLLRLPILVEYEELKKLQISAATDPLTGLYNRRLFNETFEKELNRAKRYPQSLSLVLLDLHRFKEVNDRYGHPQGDVVLQAAAETFRRTLRTSDYAFRIGGDEFAVLLPLADTEQAATMSRRVRIAFQAAMGALKLEVPVALDFGIAVYPDDGESTDTLLKTADERLYQFKNSSRSQGRDRPTGTVWPEAQRAARVGAEKPAPPPPVPPEPRREPVAPPPRVAGTTPVSQPKYKEIERRRWERVPLSGTRANAVLSEKPEKVARVLDLSFGGVALQVDPTEEPPADFYAVLNVPILPPVRVSLRKAYVILTAEGRMRVGCSFTT